MKSSIKPSVGRIVIFVPMPEYGAEAHNNATEVPAVIVRTWENTGYENDEVNLRVFCDGPETTWRTSVPYDENNTPGTWHWPPRV